MPVDDLDEQVVAILANLDIPRDFRERIEHEVQGRVDNAAAMTRMEEINEIIERIDFRWDQGFISKEEYIEKRERLARELDALRPIDYDDLIEAADLIENFRDYWCGCLKVDNPTEARQQLLHKIVDRVFVHQGQVMGVVLHGDFGVVLGQTQKASAEIANALGEILTTSGVSLSRSQFGSDGSLIILDHRFVISSVFICHYTVFFVRDKSFLTAGIRMSAFRRVATVGEVAILVRD